MAHQIQPGMRILPESMRKISDPLGLLGTLPGLLAESSPEDLQNVMAESGVDYAVTMPFPPYSDNAFVEQACSHDSHLIQGFYVSQAGPPLELTATARALFFYPALDGGDPHDDAYRNALAVAKERSIPVILCTGMVHSNVIFKNPELGKAEAFESWFADFPQIQFVLARMNLHDPGVIFDLADRYPNIGATTAWQPPEMIGEAVQRMGAERVYFGTEWPLVGHNMTVGLARIRDCVESQTLTEEQANLIMGENAQRLLNLS
jgi:hypothetical protein